MWRMVAQTALAVVFVPASRAIYNTWSFCNRGCILGGDRIRGKFPSTQLMVEGRFKRVTKGEKMRREGKKQTTVCNT